ncbi:DinB family protein [Hymenobacter arizonensis]|uniref:Uncharacterized damage-inducible protein DinB (Forms a four-helix bundle) n=1 Tax=Hymenobacter arizonensis TaxID=1227077 RepID=A0A1I6ABI7_HYMAR|nr:DinB family protein [Hymenobacter arizonensis]SFQ66059.1 Uncharacterized damage-inducible protein DinB (forms a four-helix bundle) [Hymenobacter arizonensis]
MMLESTRLLNQIRQAFDGEPWSGPSLRATLGGLTAAQAAQHPVAGAHSIWEIVLHIPVWSAVVSQRLAGNVLPPLADSEDWPPQPQTPTEADWQASLAALQAAHEQLLTVGATVADGALDIPLGPTFENSEGPGYTPYVMLHGVAQHYLYHAGQIALLRKAVA